MKKVWIALITLCVLAGAAAGITWGVQNFLKKVAVDPGSRVPTTTVRRGRVEITVTSKGELQGGNSETVEVPKTGVGEVAITSLRHTGEIVSAGDTIMELDTTQQEYNLREAQADNAEAEEHVKQAELDAKASLEEARLAILAAAGQVELAQLEVRKNPILAATAAHQNDIALEAARNRKDQADRDYKNRQVSTEAAVNVQRANQEKAKLLIKNAQENIDGMVVKAKTGGYVYVMGNSQGVMRYEGAVIPDYKVGDTVRTGQAIAQIPDMSTWEVRTGINEMDRGYLQVGEKVAIQPPVLAGRSLKGHITVIGGTMGYGAYRRFDCRVALDEKSPALRPGMSVTATITVAALDNVLWLPSQAIFDDQGRSVVYVNSPQGFLQREVTRARRGESQTVIEGLAEGTEVAMSRPDEQSQDGDTGNGVMKALTK